MLSLIVFLSAGPPAQASKVRQGNAQEKLAALEIAANGHLGVYGFNTETNKSIAYHANERFPFCSTCKVLSVSAALKVSEKKKNFLQKKISYNKFNLVEWSPITKKNIDAGMSIVSLCEAAITHSDNTAVNLLVKKLGGPKEVTAFARSIGDDSFMLNRIEPELNTAIPGDKRDTTTPKAMANSLRKLVLGNVLAPSQRDLLTSWLVNNTTGKKRIRAGTPSGWKVADKTGTSEHYGVTNDVGIVWQENGVPIVIAIYFTQVKENATPLSDVIADATRVVLQSLSDN